MRRVQGRRSRQHTYKYINASQTAEEDFGHHLGLCASATALAMFKKKQSPSASKAFVDPADLGGTSP